MMTTYFWLLLGMTAALPHLKGQGNPTAGLKNNRCPAQKLKGSLLSKS